MKFLGSGLSLPQWLRLFKGTILTEFAVIFPVKILDNLTSILVLDGTCISVLLFFKMALPLLKFCIATSRISSI